MLDVDFGPWLDDPLRGDPGTVRRALTGVLEDADLATLIELHEGVWWSSASHGAGDAAVAFVSRVTATIAAAGCYPVLAVHLRTVCLNAWELTWDHRELLAVIDAGRLPAEAAASPGDLVAAGLLELVVCDLLVETACATTSFAEVARQADAAVARCAGISAAVDDLGPGSFTTYARATVARRQSYLTAVAAAAVAARDWLLGGRDDLDAAIAGLVAAEQAQAGDPFCEAELRAHRVSLEALAAARELDWLVVDQGSVQIIYPFGLRGAAYDAVVEHVKTHAWPQRWVLAGCEVDNAPTQLLLVDDVWRGDDPLERQYEGTQYDLPAIEIDLADPAGVGHGAPGTVLRLRPRLVLSRLGNHHLSISIDLTGARPHVLAFACWLGAPEFGALGELARLDRPDAPVGLGFVDRPRRWDRLADLVHTVLTDLTGCLNQGGIGEIELSSRRGMSHVLTTVYAASRHPGGRAEGSRRLTSATELCADATGAPLLFGSQILRHPVPSGIGSLAAWSRYVPQGVELTTAGLIEECLVTNDNATLLASFHSPLYMVGTVAEAVEFVVSLDGLFSAWQDDLAAFYQRLRDEVEALVGQIDADGVIEVDHRRYADVLDNLELEQIRLRRFTTRARVSLMFVRSPALVTSPVMRRTIDDLLATRAGWRDQDGIAELAEQVLGDRLDQLIASWTRRRLEARAEEERLRDERRAADDRVLAEQERVRAEDEARRQERREAADRDRAAAMVARQIRERERAELNAQTMGAALTAIGVSGLVAIVQSAIDLPWWVWVYATLGVVLLALGFAVAVRVGFTRATRGGRVEFRPTVRPARPDEVAAVHTRILAGAFPPTELVTSTELTRQVRAGEADLWVGEAGGEPVAAAVTQRIGATRIHLLTYFATRSEVRGHGIGGVVLEQVLDRLERTSRPTLVLGEVEHPDHHPDHPEHGRPAARLRFYAGHGARVLDTGYAQPSLGPGLEPVYGMLLIALRVRPDLTETSAGVTRLTADSEVADALAALMPPDEVDPRDRTAVEALIARARDGIVLHGADAFRDAPVLLPPSQR